MLLDDVNELFLIDASHLTGELQRHARGRQTSTASALSAAASAADALCELLRTLGLNHYADCSHRLCLHLRDPESPLDADMGRAAAATLAARFNDLIEELRHKRLQDDGSEFAAMWMAEYGGDAPAAAVVPDEPAPPEPALLASVAPGDDAETPGDFVPTEPSPLDAVPEVGESEWLPEDEFVETLPAAPEPAADLSAPFFPIDMAPDGSDGAEDLFLQQQKGAEFASPQATEVFGFENLQRVTLLAQARRLHARLDRLPAGPDKTALGEEVRQLLQGLRMATRQIGSVPLATPVSASLLALGALAVAFEHLEVCRAEPRAAGAGLVCIDVEVASSSANGMWAASKAIGHCGGRIDASPAGWRLTVPADTDLLSVVVLETDAGPLAVHALQFEAWVADDAHSPLAIDGEVPGGSLALRLGALEAEFPLRSSTASFSAPAETCDVWRFELPLPEHWPCPPGWDALVADNSGRLMALLAPQAVHSGEQYQLTEFA